MCCGRPATNKAEPGAIYGESFPSDLMSELPFAVSRRCTNLHALQLPVGFKNAISLDEFAVDDRRSRAAFFRYALRGWVRAGDSAKHCAGGHNYSVPRRIEVGFGVPGSSECPGRPRDGQFASIRHNLE